MSRARSGSVPGVERVGLSRPLPASASPPLPPAAPSPNSPRLPPAAPPPPQPHAGEVFGAELPVAEAYARLLCGPGVQRGLLGPREPARIWDRHLLNSAAMAPLIPAGATVVDLGSGAGLPGIPLLLARPDLNMTLVEPMRRRAEFLRECVQQLDLRCVVVERPAQELRLSADVVVARAVAGLARLVELAEPIAAGRGALLALKGRSAAQELAAAGLGGAAQAELVQIGAGPWAVNVIRVTWARRGRQTGGRPRARRGRSE